MTSTLYIYQSVAEVAEDIWDRYGHDFGTNYSGLFKALCHVNYNVRLATAEALAAALDEKPDSIQVSLCLASPWGYGVYSSLYYNVFLPVFFIFFLNVFFIASFVD